MAMKRTFDEDARCLMDEVTLNLTGMASLSIGDGVRDHLWPIVAKSSKPISELRSGLVRSTCVVMSFFDRLRASLCERHQSKIPSYDRRYSIRVIALL